MQARTADELTLLARAEEMRGDVDAHQLAEPVGRDPLMALKLLAAVRRRSAHAASKMAAAAPRR